MAVVTELELPELDFFASDLRGERFHETMGELSAADWLATSAIGYFVLDREAAAFFLRTRAATFPGMKIAEMFEVPEGPLLEQMRRNILHLGGDDHRRLRNLRLHAARRRSLAPGDARLPRAAMGAARRSRAMRVRRRRRKALSVAHDRHRDGRAAR